MANIEWSEAPEGHDEQCEMFGRPITTVAATRSTAGAVNGLTRTPGRISALRQADVAKTDHHTAE